MFNKEELKNAVALLARIIQPKTSMPILQNIMFSKSKDGFVTLSATNLSTSLNINIHCKGDLQGFCLPARKFNDLLKLLNSENITIKLGKNNVKISKDKGYSTFPTMNISEFPVTYIQDGLESFSVDADILVSSLSKCLSAISDNEAHPVLNGALIKSEDNILTFASADGFRMTQIKLMIGCPDFEIVIPKTSVQHIIQIFDDSGKLNISITQDHLYIWNDKIQFKSQLVFGSFPAVERIIPNTFGTTIVIDKSELNRNLKQALIFARDAENIVKLCILDESIKLSANDLSAGENESTITNVEIDGTPLDIAINGLYLQDALAFANDKIILKFNSSTTPIGVYISGCDTFTHIMMPMHLGR